MQLDRLRSFNPGEEWVAITTLDVHTGGEPLRIITSDLELPGETILEKRRWINEHADHIRTCLMWEPRGHREMYGCIVTPPVNPGSDMGVIFLHNEGYSTMCGHGIIGLATAAVETGLVPMADPETIIRIDSPAGLITAHVRVTEKGIRSVFFHNVPSFVVTLDDTVNVSGLGKVRFDLAFGGAYYAYVDAPSVGLKCEPSYYPDLIAKGMAIKKAVIKHRKLKHPYEKDLNFLYGTIFTTAPIDKDSHSRNVCIFADGEVDRSPTGTGVSGRAAIHFARGQIGLNEPIVIESIIGTKFSVKAVEAVTFGDFPAIIPEVEGTAYITGRHEFLIDPSDPLKHGFFMG